MYFPDTKTMVLILLHQNSFITKLTFYFNYLNKEGNSENI